MAHALKSRGKKVPALLWSQGDWPMLLWQSFCFKSPCAAGADTKRKGIPKWLSDELEKIEKKRQKTLDKEAAELSEKARQEEGRPAWRDEESDHEEDEKTTPGQDMWKITPRSSHQFRSESPNGTSVSS